MTISYVEDPMGAGMPLMIESLTLGKTWMSFKARDIGFKWHSNPAAASDNTAAPGSSVKVCCIVFGSGVTQSLEREESAQGNLSFQL